MSFTVSPNSVFTFQGTTDPTNSVFVGSYFPLIGSFYVNTTTKAQFSCTDPTFGAQVWLPIVGPIKTFTPIVKGSTTAGTGTYSIQTGYYAQNGYNIFAKGTITWSAHTGTGNMLIGNFPLAFANLANSNPVGEVILENISIGSASISLNILGNANTTNAQIVGTKTSSPLYSIAMDAPGTIHFSITYLT